MKGLGGSRAIYPATLPGKHTQERVHRAVGKWGCQSTEVGKQDLAALCLGTPRSKASTHTLRHKASELWGSRPRLPQQTHSEGLP